MTTSDDNTSGSDTVETVATGMRSNRSRRSVLKNAGVALGTAGTTALLGSTPVAASDEDQLWVSLTLPTVLYDRNVSPYEAGDPKPADNIDPDSTDPNASLMIHQTYGSPDHPPGWRRNLFDPSWMEHDDMSTDEDYLLVPAVVDVTTNAPAWYAEQVYFSIDVSGGQQGDFVGIYDPNGDLHDGSDHLDPGAGGSFSQSEIESGRKEFFLIFEVCGTCSGQPRDLDYIGDLEFQVQFEHNSIWANRVGRTHVSQTPYSTTGRNLADEAAILVEEAAEAYADAMSIAGHGMAAGRIFSVAMNRQAMMRLAIWETATETTPITTPEGLLQSTVVDGMASFAAELDAIGDAIVEDFGMIGLAGPTVYVSE